ncbi:MAG: hypothetical protein HOL65_05525 [Microbacteriaceae bacterium]|nr:hypothetical protein [Microbacteriaceae bacterium]
MFLLPDTDLTVTDSRILKVLIIADPLFTELTLARGGRVTVLQANTATLRDATPPFWTLRTQVTLQGADSTRKATANLALSGTFICRAAGIPHVQRAVGVATTGDHGAKKSYRE